MRLFKKESEFLSGLLFQALYYQARKSRLRCDFSLRC